MSIVARYCTLPLQGFFVSPRGAKLISRKKISNQGDRTFSSFMTIKKLFPPQKSDRKSESENAMIMWFHFVHSHPAKVP
ncbi:hypothetical protein [Cylindrospermum sp. FACHB-282]|uniref:hypothetical protein n=1 Tax=Cylindrospermum sp. FACHB-282 TaxID=2692794 RepID=UPI001685A084|nr:hypothetical protein [Cylindrospermum sp. FACHB-282]MBD2384111.1 hypothetical protein [Cylindrospermum sp. FACHB-282]